MVLYQSTSTKYHKTNLIKFTPKTTAHVPLDIHYKDNVTDEVTSTKFLGMHIDSHMN